MSGPPPEAFVPMPNGKTMPVAKEPGDSITLAQAMRLIRPIMGAEPSAGAVEALIQEHQALDGPGRALLFAALAIECDRQCAVMAEFLRLAKAGNGA